MAKSSSSKTSQRIFSILAVAGWILVTFTTTSPSGFNPENSSIDKSKSISLSFFSSTATTQIADEPPAETVIIVCPGVIALTTPYSSTVATSGLLDVRVIVLSIPSVFEIFSADTSQLGVPYWLIDGSKEKENKTMIDRDGTTPFYYRKSGVEAGVKVKIYIDKNSYINSDYCQSGSCKIAK